MELFLGILVAIIAFVLIYDFILGCIVYFFDVTFGCYMDNYFSIFKIEKEKIDKFAKLPDGLEFLDKKEDKTDIYFFISKTGYFYVKLFNIKFRALPPFPLNYRECLIALPVIKDNTQYLYPLVLYLNNYFPIFLGKIINWPKFFRKITREQVDNTLKFNIENEYQINISPSNHAIELPKDRTWTLLFYNKKFNAIKLTSDIENYSPVTLDIQGKLINKKVDGFKLEARYEFTKL